MKTERSVKLIRKEKRQKPPEVEAEAEDHKSWSIEVKSWVAKFQLRRSTESQPPFSSLFK